MEKILLLDILSINFLAQAEKEKIYSVPDTVRRVSAFLVAEASARQIWLCPKSARMTSYVESSGQFM